MSLVEHLESRLGKIKGGWRADNPAEQGQFGVAYFEEGVLPGVGAYSTIGLSNTPVPAPASDRDLFLEFITLEYGGAPDTSPWPNVIEEVARLMFARNSAVYRGEVIRLAEPIGGSDDLLGVYASMPSYFDHAFNSVQLSNGKTAAVVWLFSITQREISFIEQRGFEEFEDMLVRVDPDLLSLSRASMV